MSRVEHLRLLWSLLRNHKIHFTACVFLIMGNSIILGGALSGILPVISSFISPEGVTGHINAGYFGNVLSLYNQFLSGYENSKLVSLGVLFIIMMINTTVEFITVRINSGLTAKLTCDCRKRIYDTIQHMKASSLDRNPRGTVVQLLITETRSVYAVFKQILLVAATFFNIVVISTLLVLLSWKLSIILFAGSLLLVLVNLSIVKRVKQLSKLALDMRAELMHQATEGIWGLKQIKLMQAGAIVSERFNSASRRSESMARRIAIKNGLQGFISENVSIGIVLTIIVCWLYSPFFFIGVPSTAGIITFLILMSRLGPFIGTISREYGIIFANLPAVSRVNEFLVGKLDLEDEGSYEPASFLQDKICLRDVCFEHTPGTLVLNSINLEINKGSYIAIVGRSGGGKSTLFNLFTRIYDPTSGELFIDGTNIRDFRLSYLRSHVGMVSQDFFLFNTTIRDNLLLAKPSATEKELYMVLEKAGLLTFVNSLDKNLETQVGNNGDRLSGGQRQRLCLAAIFLLDPDVIILDEGTSSVDHETEIHILSSIREFHRQGKTIIASAHKESALSDAEYIYSLNNGQMTLLSLSEIQDP